MCSETEGKLRDQIWDSRNRGGHLKSSERIIGGGWASRTGMK